MNLYLPIATLFALFFLIGFILKKYRYTLLRYPWIIFAVWCLTGLMFSTMYWLVDSSTQERAFNAGFYSDKDVLALIFQYIYFSFITITTIGFGDLHPLHYLARIIVMIESAAGLVVAACLAGSVIFHLTRQTEKPRINRIMMELRDDGTSSWIFSFDKFYGSLGTFEVLVGYLYNGQLEQYVFNESDCQTSNGQFSFIVKEKNLILNYLPAKAEVAFIQYKTSLSSDSNYLYLKVRKKAVLGIQKAHELWKIKSVEEKITLNTMAFFLDFKLSEHRSLNSLTEIEAFKASEGTMSVTRVTTTSEEGYATTIQRSSPSGTRGVI